jgi:myo-inositol 2-dehydrogenase/D-chiro-inositol 1-dehydrogenase
MDDGDCWSHFDAVYTYPNDVHIAFASAQFGGRWDVRMQYFGSHGFAEATYDAPVRIEGPTPWEFPGLGTPVETSQDDAVAGNFAGALDDADPNKQKAFIQSITSGDLINEAEAGVESALSAMLAREAAYTGSEVTWEKLLESTEIWDPKVDWSQFG